MPWTWNKLLMYEERFEMWMKMIGSSKKLVRNKNLFLFGNEILICM